MAPDSKGSGAIPFAICDTACWNVLGIRILIIRVCQRHALCDRRAGWDIPELDCITRSNATVREGWAIGPVDCGYLHMEYRERQLRQMQDEVPDLEDMDGGVSAEGLERQRNARRHGPWLRRPAQPGAQPHGDGMVAAP